MKKWVVSKSSGLYLIGMAVYLIGLGFLAQSYKSENIAVASIVFVIFNVVTLSLFSWFYFKETLAPLQIVGIVVGLIAIVILEIA